MERGSGKIRNDRRSSLSDEGFSLVEVLLAAGLMGAVILTVASSIQFQSRATRSVAQDNSFDSLVTLTKMALRNPKTCAASLQDNAGTQVVPVIDPTTLVMADLPVTKVKVQSSLILEVGGTFSGISVSSITLKQKIIGDPGVPTPYTMFLEIEGTKTSLAGQKAVGGSTVSGSIPISLTVTSVTTPAITSCSSATDIDPQATCSSLGGIFDIVTRKCSQYIGQMARAVLRHGWRTGVNASYTDPATVTLANPAGTPYGTFETQPLSVQLLDGPADATVYIKKVHSNDATPPVFSVIDVNTPSLATDVFRVKKGIRCAYPASLTGFTGYTICHISPNWYDETFDFIECNADNGWKLSGCWNAAIGEDNDTITWGNGCMSNDFYQELDVNLTITCVKNMF